MQVAYLETTLHEGANVGQFLGSILVTAEHEEGDTGMVGHAESRGKGGVDHLLGGTCDSITFSSGNGNGPGSGGEGCEGLEGGGVVAQETLQATESDGGKHAQVDKGRRGGGGRANGHKPVQVEEDGLDGPRVAVLRQGGKGVDNVRGRGGGSGGAVGAGRVLGGRGKDTGAVLAKALELVEELMQHVKGPLGQHKEAATAILRLLQERVKEGAVRMPSLNAVLHGGSRHRVPVPQRQLAVQSQEQLISLTLRRNGLWRRPGRGGKVLLSQKGGGA
jgi:hypothetical protein